MATTRRCPGCSAPAALAGAACHYCGTPPSPAAADEVAAPAVEVAPAPGDEAGPPATARIWSAPPIARLDQGAAGGAAAEEGIAGAAGADEDLVAPARGDEAGAGEGGAGHAGVGAGRAGDAGRGPAPAEAAGLHAVWADAPSRGMPGTERVIEVAAAAAAARADAGGVAAAGAEPEGGAGADEIGAEGDAGAGLVLEAPGEEARTDGVSVEAAGDIPSRAAGPAPDGVAADEDRPPPPAREARRIRGLLVPLVAAAVVGGIGYPLTNLAVARVGRLPATSGPAAPEEGSSPVATRSGGRTRSPVTAPGSSLGRVRLRGAVTFDGPATPVQCSAGIPVLVTFGTPADQLTIRLGLPVPPRPGVYPLQGPDLFVAVSRSGPSWTTRNHPEATGETTVRPDRSVSSQFDGLRPNGGGAEGTVSGSVEVRCA